MQNIKYTTEWFLINLVGMHKLTVFGNGSAPGFIGENIYKKQGMVNPPSGLKFCQILSG